MMITTTKNPKKAKRPKRCPFCDNGGLSLDVDKERAQTVVSISCPKCNTYKGYVSSIIGEVNPTTLVDRAIAEWNRREVEEKQKTIIDAFKEQVEPHKYSENVKRALKGTKL